MNPMRTKFLVPTESQRKGIWQVQDDCLEEVTSIEDLKSLSGWFERKVGSMHPKEGSLSLQSSGGREKEESKRSFSSPV